MGRRGRLPAPAAVQVARGETRPSRVNWEAPIPHHTHPKMPSDMSPDAKRVWRRVMKEMGDTGVIVAADHGILRAYCEAEASYVRNVGLLGGSGVVIRGSRGREVVVNPLHRIVRDDRDAMRLLARELGLSPAARAGLRMDMSQATHDMDDLLPPAPRLAVVNE